MLGFITKGIEKRQKDIDEWYAAQLEKYPGNGKAQLIANVPYIDDNKEYHKMDIYSPVDHSAKLPVIIDFHGGGLVTCTRKFNHWFCCEMARRGALVFNVDYPLVPESDVFGIFEDAYAALVRIFDIVEDCGGDKRNVTLCGDSAGAFIATYLAAASNDEEIAKSMGIWNMHMPIKSVVGISGMYYSSRVDTQGLFMMRNEFFGKKCTSHPFWQYINPETIIAMLPKFMMITSTGDFLRKYTLDLADAMMEAGKDMVLRDFEGEHLEHDFVCLQHDTEEAQQAMDEIMRFITSY